MAESHITKEEFKRRWNLDDDGDGITYDDIAECAVAWGLYTRPKIQPMDVVLAKVLAAAVVRERSK